MAAHIIIEYITATKQMTGAHFGRQYVEDEWSSYNQTGKAVIHVESDISSTYGKYLIITDGTATLGNASSFNLSTNKTIDSDTQLYALTANGSDTFTVTGIPEGATVSIDGTAAGTMDASGIFNFNCTDGGIYFIGISLYTYEPTGFNVNATGI